MLVPSVFKRNLVNNFFDDMFLEPFGSKNFVDAMSTDVKDLGDTYELSIELPGFEKKDIHAQLDQGYLKLSAENESNKESKDNEGTYIRRERYIGRCERSFYVGNDVKEEDIKAGFENGVLKIVFPKKENRR